MDYLDASVAVALLAVEPSSERIAAWLLERPVGSLCISAWGHTEVASALALKVRTGALSLDQRAASLARWRTMREQSFVDIPVLPAHFDAAADYMADPMLGLRAGDALHLAIAAAGGHRVVTLDDTLLAAASAFGVDAIAP